MYNKTFLGTQLGSETDELLLAKIHDLLYHLGITAKYTGFFYTSHGLHLTVRQPERLLLITKWLYPDIARHFHTDWRNVERGIRTCAGLAWALRSEQLQQISKEILISRPNNTQFISILTSNLRSQISGTA